MDPVIRNFRNVYAPEGPAARMIWLADYVMLHNDPMQPGAVSHPDTGGHNHQWEHVVFVLEGTATFVCDGKDYTVSQGDALLVPPNVHHQWKNESQAPVVRVTYNPVASEAAEH